jgi:hypothetical protein
VALLAAGGWWLAAGASSQAAESVVDRPGFIYGFALSGGVMDFDREEGLAVFIPGPPFRIIQVPSEQGGAGLATFMGWGITRRLAAGVDVQVMAGLHDDDFNNLIGGVVLQYWPTARWWLRAGVGGGKLRLPDPNASYRDGQLRIHEIQSGGFAVQASAGFEFLQRRKWTLEVQVRYATVGYELLRVTHLSLNVGVGGY